jgi:hypothetical protein
MDKAAKTAGELSELLTAEMTRRVGPTALRRGVSPVILGRHRDSPDQPNWTADPGRLGRTVTVRFGSAWAEVLDGLQPRYDLRD